MPFHPPIAMTHCTTPSLLTVACSAPMPTLGPLLSPRSFVAALMLSVCTFFASSSPATAQAQSPRLLIVGDSISAGYGLPQGSGWTELLSARLKERGYGYRVVNASISGDTTAGGRARLPSLLAQHHPAIVVIELGGNDGLRGGDLKATRDNLDKMVSLVQQAGSRVL